MELIRFYFQKVGKCYVWSCGLNELKLIRKEHSRDTWWIYNNESYLYYNDIVGCRV